MKKSFTSKIRVIILLIFLISLVQGTILLKLVTNFDDITLKMNIQNTVIITVFIQFVLALVLIFYIPVFLRKAFAEIHQILKEISLGNYHVDIDLDNFKKSMGNEFFAVILSISKMLSSVFKFNILKKAIARIRKLIISYTIFLVPSRLSKLVNCCQSAANSLETMKRIDTMDSRRQGR